jgi:hypothetical protein
VKSVVIVRDVLVKFVVIVKGCISEDRCYSEGMY